MESERFNPARYSNKISERYYSIEKKWNPEDDDYIDPYEEEEEIINKDIKIVELIASCWDGETLYTNITRAELLEITGATPQNVSLGLKRESSRYKGWVYSKDLNMAEIELDEYVNAYGDDGNRYYFGFMTDIIANSTGLNLGKEEIHRMYYKDMVEVEGVRIYINHK